MIIPPPASWGSSFVLGFSCIAFLVVSAIGSAIFLIYIRHIRPRIRARRTANLHRASTSKAVDQEKKVDPSVLPYSAVVPVNPSPVRPAPMAPQPQPALPPPEPQLPWPVLAVLPSLRPKEPMHVRMKNAVGWNKEEVKHEPFTVADVMRAMEEASVQVEMRGSNSVLPNPEPAHGNADSSSRSMPEIVVHPADGKPSFSPALEEWSVSAPSEVSTATVSSASPTESDPDPETPHFSSPYDHSSPKVYFSSPPITSTESLRVPVHSPNARDDGQAMAVNVSNFSGQKFVLSTPPGKRYAPAARGPGPGPGAGQRGPSHAQIGLGFVHGTPVRAPRAADLSDTYEGDSSLDIDISNSSLAVGFNPLGSSVAASPPSPASASFSLGDAYSARAPAHSKTSTMCATDGHSQSSRSSQSTWGAGAGGRPVHSRLSDLRDPKLFYDSPSGSGSDSESGNGSGSGGGNGVPDATPANANANANTNANAPEAEADAETKTISEENYFDCSAEFEEEDITVQSASLVYHF